MTEKIYYRASSDHERLDYAPYKANGQNLPGPLLVGADSGGTYRRVVLNIDNILAVIIQ